MPCLVKTDVTVWKYVKTEHTCLSLCTERDYLCTTYETSVFIYSTQNENKHQ